MSLWRKAINVSWSEKVCNEVLRHVSEDRTIISVINRRQRDWLGHNLRHSDFVPSVFEGGIIRKRPPARPREVMLD